MIGDKEISAMLVKANQELEERLKNEKDLTSKALELINELEEKMASLVEGLEKIQEAMLNQEIILPEGWQIVPKFIGDSMYEVFHRIMFDSDEEMMSTQAYWNMLLAAAPQWEGGVKEQESQKLKTFYTTSFAGYWPVGTCAVVQAFTAEEAAELLNLELVKAKLPAQMEAAHMQLYDFNQPNARILLDGNY